MERPINLKPSELNASIVEILQRMAQESEVSDITIHAKRSRNKMKEKKTDYKASLDVAIQNIEKGVQLRVKFHP